ncbi:MAG: crotonase/enoyl-CoA hydratase family protein [Kangiellaceae bacterium]|nr:crotonase/enoyl-CoA hydratase family protein [Kangiellaceae bacterium]
MDLVDLEFEQSIATITLQNGKANAISPQVIVELNQALDQAEKQQAVVILTGQDGIFSAGFDLKVMRAGTDSALALITEGSKLSRRLLSFPYPVIIACSGHAVAKGAFLLLSADYRIGCSGDFKTALNEVAIGMTMHFVGVELARGRLSSNYLSRVILNAEPLGPQAAVAAGFFDELVSTSELMKAAREKALELQKLDMTAHSNTKLRVRKPLLDALDSAIEVDLKSIAENFSIN